MSSFKSLQGKLDLSKHVALAVESNPKKGALNAAWWDAIAAAIRAAGGHIAIKDLHAALKDSGVPTLAEVRHNLARGYYRFHDLTPNLDAAIAAEPAYTALDAILDAAADKPAPLAMAA